MQLDSLQKLYEHSLKDLHSAERQIIQALPKMIKAAQDEQLSATLQQHLEITREQLARLDQIFETLGKRGTGKKCKGMEGLIEEGKELLEEDAEPEVLDAGIISAAQHVEHYEMAGYGTAVAYARQLGDDQAAQLLEQSLAEEKEADRLLSELALSRINLEAEATGEEENGGASMGGSRGRGRSSSGSGSSARKSSGSSSSGRSSGRRNN